MAIISEKETMNIDEVAKKIGCSDSTVRRMLKSKSIPQAIKRKNKRETLRWRRTDIEAFLGTQLKKPEPQSTLEQLIRSLVMKELQSVLREYDLA